jgi:hypothetical protein
MLGIRDAQERVIEFFVREMGREREAVRIIKLSQSGEGWEAKVEVTEPNEYLKKLGHPSIFDRNIYTIGLDPGLEVTGYALTSSRERSSAEAEREDR